MLTNLKEVIILNDIFSCIIFKRNIVGIRPNSNWRYLCVDGIRYSNIESTDITEWKIKLMIVFFNKMKNIIDDDRK